MKRQILSVFLTSLLLLACESTPGRCTQHIGSGRTAVINSREGGQRQVTAGSDGVITYECGATVTII